MSHGNLSPRQKMINMMYLILTALLAMNVSAEILNAFVLVNDSLIKTERGITGKNDEVYGRFANLNQANPSKVGPWKEKADAIGKTSSEIVAYITELQKTMLEGSGDSYEKFSEEGTIAIENKKDRENPIRIMLEEKVNGKSRAEALKEQLDAYREQVNGFLSGVPGSDPILASMMDNLNTGDVTGQDGKTKTWERANFDQMPLVAVITLLTKLKTDILNIESDAINHLIQRVDATSYKFTNLNALVMSDKGYILSGEKYEAKIFVGAQDTTQKPVIILDNGTRIDSFDSEGKGIYKITPSGYGTFDLKGKILVQRPGSSEIDSFPFATTYQVAPPSVSVSATKMNVFYIGVDNPVDIAAAGTPADQISASVGGGTIRRVSGSSFNVRVKRPGNTRVVVSANGRTLGSAPFRVKSLPSPITTIGAPNAAYHKGGNCPQSTLLALSGINATMENFEFDARYTIYQFTTTVNIGGFDESAKSNSRRFTTQQKSIIRKAKRGSRVIIEEVRARGPDGTSRKINDLVLKLR
jgi:gliding motility-associated protein GldM